MNQIVLNWHRTSSRTVLCASVGLCLSCSGGEADPNRALTASPPAAPSPDSSGADPSPPSPDEPQPAPTASATNSSGAGATGEDAMSDNATPSRTAEQPPEAAAISPAVDESSGALPSDSSDAEDNPDQTLPPEAPTEQPQTPPEPPLDPCEAIPSLDPVIGWAATPGRGLDTTTGGGDNAPQVVSSLSELQRAVAGDEPAVVWVRGQLEPGDLAVGSNKTVFGTCGAEIHGHVEIREAQNVIFHNLTIVGYAPGDCSLDPDFDPTEGCSSGADAVTIQRDAHHVWFDHMEVRDGTDGNLDITNGADLVTVSWTKFAYTPRTDTVGDDSTGAAGHRYSNLVGGTNSPNNFDDENSLNVTWHHNWWADNVVERQPRVRFGKNHLFNNLYDSQTANYCVRAGIGAQVLLEANVFEGVDDPHEFNNSADEATAHITADDSNLYLETTSDRATGGGGQPFGQAPYPYTLQPALGLPTLIRTEAGPR